MSYVFLEKQELSDYAVAFNLVEVKPKKPLFER